MRRPLLIGAALLAACGCNVEKRVSDVQPAVASTSQGNRESELVAGPYVPLADLKNPFENNQQAINQGQRLYKWFNCSGCHGQGGGGIGPPLMDSKWIYGAQPGNIYETIVKGRPNGMPSFAGKIPEYQIWQLVAYVQSLSSTPPPGEK